MKYWMFLLVLLVGCGDEPIEIEIEVVPTPDMRIYELRERSWTYINQYKSTSEDVTAFMGEPDEIFEEEGRIYWYYTVTPGKFDLFFVFEDGVVNRINPGPVYKELEAAREATLKADIAAAEVRRKEAKEKMAELQELETDEP